ncbi:MAG: UDP-N-acetylmuramate--L-alanine ligase [Firmicutes bacterium]|nr:UDP-N-acetylmuramate--L-alanine ligase [Bacillota bacterium]
MNKNITENYKNVYFIGIGGVSMSGLAEILCGMGINVSGSDMKPSEATKHIEDLGIKVNYGHFAENISPDLDLVVYTAAVKADNPEVVAAHEHGIETVERADLLGAIMSNYGQSIAISGTHGKTTTTSMTSEILLAAGTDPTITVGGTLPSINGNIKVGKSQYFVAEACEYHNSFLKFNPFIGVILNIEADHLDFFKDIDEIKNSFKKFAMNVPKEGYVIINHDAYGMEFVTKDLKCHVVTFGMSNSADWCASNIKLNANGTTSFGISFRGNEMGTVSLNVPGEHNVLNALAACAASHALGIGMKTITEALESYSGVNRRFQEKGAFDGVNVIDDYAHHPSEIRATLAAAKNIPHNKLWCVFQPHTYTRAKALIDEFAVSFGDADNIIVADIYAAREKDTGLINSNEIAEKIRSSGKNAIYVGNFDDIIAYIKSTVSKGDMLITMGAGDVYLIGERLING